MGGYKMYDVMIEYINNEKELEDQIQRLKQDAERYVDKSIHDNKIKELEREITRAKPIYRQKLRDKADQLKASIEKWAMPTVEGIQDLELLKADIRISEEQIILLQDKHKNNNAMLEALFNYSLNNKYYKALGSRYPRREDKLKAIKDLYNFYDNVFTPDGGFFKRSILRDNHIKTVDNFNKIIGNRPIKIQATEEELKSMISTEMGKVKKSMNQITEEHNKAIDWIDSYNK